jgi:hypothetical protein
LFRALTGQHPFDHDSYPMLVLKICTEPPPPLRRYRPDLPPEIEQIAAKMLAKSPDERFQNCAAVKAALKPYELFSDVPIVNEVARNDALPLASIAGGMSSYAATAHAPSSPGVNTPVVASAARQQSPAPMLDSGTPLATQTVVGIPGQSKLPLYVGAGAVVVVLAVIGLALSGAFSGGNSNTVTPIATVAQPPAAPVVQPLVPREVAAPAAERNVNIRISTTPPGAELLIDGRRRANPFNAQLPYSEDMHTVEVRSPGFMTVMQDLDLSLTQEITIPLERGTGTQDRRAPRARPSGGNANGAAQVNGTTAAVPPGPTEPAGGTVTPPPERRPTPPEVPAVRPPPLEDPPPPNPDIVAPPPRTGFKTIRI